MKEHDFIKQLQLRAKEQEQLLGAMPYPKIFLYISRWFSDYPLRYIIPIALLLSIFLRLTFGLSYTNFILWLFSRL
jgi:hypothetical protein